MKFALKKNFKISLKLKIAFMFVLLVLVMMITVGYIFTVKEQNLRVEQVKERMERLARNIATIRSVETEDWEVYQAYIDNQITINQDIVYIAIFDERGDLKVHSLNTDWLELENPGPLTIYESVKIVLRLDQRQIAEESQQDIESQSVNIIIGNQNRGKVNIGFSLIDLNDEMRSNLVRSLLLDAFFIILAIIFSFIISSRIVIPLGRLTKAMEKISKGDFQQKLQIDSRDEIGEMAKTFNFMAKGLQEKQIIENFSHELAFTIELKKILNLITERIAQALNSRQAYFFLREKEQASHFDLVVSYPEKLNRKISLARDQQLCNLAIQNRNPLSFKELEAHPALQSQLGKLKKINKNTLICPLIIKDKVLGILILTESNRNKPFSKNEINFLNTLLAQGSVAIENAVLYVELTDQERLKHELEIAKSVQLSLLPQQNPEISGMDIDGICIPALEVGGDYYDYFVLSDHTLGIVVADVTGKGTSAAFYMAMVKGIMLSLVPIYASPGQLLKELNQRLYGIMDRKAFITMIYATVDLQNKIMTFARAGHNALIMANAKNTKIECLTPKGIGLGLAHDRMFNRHINEQIVNFQSGDMFLFYTDGIPEAMNQGLEEFGEQRLIEIVAQSQNGSASHIREGIIRAVDQFVQDAPQHDDITLITLKAT